MTIQTEQVRVEFVADTSKLRKGSEEAKESLDSVKDSIENQKGSWSKASEMFSKFAPGIKGTSDSISDMSETFGEMFEGVKAGVKGMKLAIIAAIALIAVKLAKMAWTVASETSRAYNAQEYDKVIERREASMRKLKTAIGSFTAPIVNAINTAIGGILDGVTWVLKKVHAGLSFVYGFLKGLLTPVIDAVKKGIESVGRAIQPIVDGIKNAINGIASFLGFGPVFKSSAKGADEASDAIEDVGEASEYAEGALQGFDKLNVMDNLTGDANTANEIDDTSKAMQELGESLSGKLFEYLKKIPELLSSIDLGKMWDDFKKKALDTINTIRDSLLRFGTWVWNGISGTGSYLYEKLSGVWNTLTSTMSGLWSWLISTLSSMWDGLTISLGTTWNSLVSLISGAWGTLTSTMGGMWTSLVSMVSGLWSGATSFITGLWNGFSGYIQGDFLNAIHDTIEKISGAFGSAWDSIGKLFNKVISPIKSMVDWLIEKVQWLSNKVASLKEAVSNIGSTISNIGSSIVGGVKSLFGGADGAVFSPNDPFPIMVGDNTKEPEVLSPVSTMKSAFKEAISEMGGVGGSRGSGTIEITLNVDGKTLARATYDDLVAEGNRRGRRTIA